MNKLFDPDSLHEVWLTISHNPRRSILTAFGVFWGVFMLVVMLSVGNGIKGGIFSQFDSVPANMSICWTNNTTVPYAGFRKGRVWNIKSPDVDLLRSRVSDIQKASIQVNGRSVSVSNGDKSGMYRISGVDGNYCDIMPVQINAGRYINSLDVKEGRKVVVLGQKIVDEVFKGHAPIGEYVTVGGISYQCIGVSESTSNSINMGGREEETIHMPYTVVQRIYNMGDVIHVMMIIAQANTPIERLEREIRAELYSLHSISPDDTAALECINLDKIFQLFRALGMGIGLLIWIVGLGTLASGAIGVSNIVMITVKERTTEIGVRRAIGAKPFDIITQIMCESLLITFAAGIVGLVCGVGIMDLLGSGGNLSFGENFKLVNPMLDFNTAVAALIVIIIIGILAGLMPAARAMKIKAIDAIREE